MRKSLANLALKRDIEGKIYTVKRLKLPYELMQMAERIWFERDSKNKHH